MYLLNLIEKKSKLLLMLSAFLTLISSVISLIIPLNLKSILNHSVNTEHLLSLSFPILFLIVINIFIQAIATFIFLMEGAKLVRNLRIKLTNQIVNSPILFFKESNSAEIISHVVNDTSAIGSFISDIVPLIISNGIMFLGSLIFLCYLNLFGTIILLITFLIPILFILFLSIGLSSISKYIQEKIAVLNNHLLSLMDRISLVKISNSQISELNNINKIINDLYHKKVAQSKRMSFVNPLMTMGAILSIIIELVYCVIQLKKGELSIGAVVAYFIYLFQIVAPLSGIGNIIASIGSLKGTMAHIDTIYQQKTETIENGLELSDYKIKKIELNDVSYVYENKKILYNISLSAKEGEFIALVGPSGSGKTTILNIISTLYSKTSGDIYLNENHLEIFKLSFLRSRMSYAFQETKLMQGSITDNVIYYSDYEENKLAKIKNSKLLSFVSDWKTDFKDIQKSFSGGEVQRIGIARALYKPADVLLLDEITANLDANSEKIVDQLINNFKKDKIIIVAAHRLSTITNANRIYFVDNGKITGIGTHESLYNSHDKYREFVDTQLI